MSKSQRKRRRRNGQGSSAPSAAANLLRDNYQKNGGLGIVSVVAHFAAGESSDELPTRERGMAFANMVASERSKFGAGALAAIAEVWPNDEVRAHARRLLSGRRKQLSGVLRELGEVEVSGTWRLTNEYGDIEVLFLELTIHGRHLTTLAAVIEQYRRGDEVILFRLPACEAADQCDVTSDIPGGPRRVFEEVSYEDTRFEMWMFMARRGRIVGDGTAIGVLDWLPRLLDIDVEFPQLPSFDRDAGVGNEPDVDEVLDEFLYSDAGRSWGSDGFDELVDHLRWFESEKQAMQWSPARVEHFLLFHPHDLEDGPAYAMPALLRGWVAHCASITRQRKPLLQEVLAEIDRCEPRFFADAA